MRGSPGKSWPNSRPTSTRRRGCADLSVSQKQTVEIAKAISRKADVIIMDEPTAVLTSHEVEILFKVIRRLVQSGVSIVYISHKLDEVKEISQRVTILRDGHRIATEPTEALSADEMAVRMVGRSLEDMFLPKTPPPEVQPVLTVRDVTVPGFAYHCSFELYRGEILGFAGLIGAGRTELFEGIFGLRPRAGGFVERAGRAVEIYSLKDAINCGMVYLSEDRKGKGLITLMELAPNLTLMSSVRRLGFGCGAGRSFKSWSGPLASTTSKPRACVRWSPSSAAATSKSWPWLR